ncbi:outer membrane lipoprotein LolB [Geobacter metallireducens RCH3]|uniref:Outer-membrane lipoprotein LolB n=1 Tax=Geobacter metallireducens (strain ATCC 53774 / DSM 7210 / GS-15) TaxID=269799 RepID=Q39Q84_GEOMG|nr:lipoprotein insertase outer membrane protein LolB [Geobacter metallireducens]ABB33590.1 outer membrane lipoprotein LolB, putative [Geobacter metallireducens GS-15]EHP87700.1 outer membrane lipoprotein LolB [Geobacter metallireducens RCH3]
MPVTDWTPHRRLPVAYGFLFLLALLILTTLGCATAPKPREPFIPGATVETLASGISLSVTSLEGSTGGTGYLLYRRPDSFHVVMLTPFGTTALEFFARDDRVTVLVPSKGIAYVGSFGDLPAKGGLQGWRMMRWVVEGDPLFAPGTTGTVERTDAEGRTTVARYDGEGLLQGKTSGGSEAVYRDYQSVGGVPFPATIELTDRQGVQVKISFDEPEVNAPVDDGALTPKLEGVTILPLARLAEAYSSR